MTIIDKAALADLIAMVEKLEGPDRETFLAIAAAVAPDYRSALEWRETFNAFLAVGAWENAALALVERVLLGWRRSLLEHAPGRWEAVLGRNYSGRHDSGPHEVRTGVATTPAIALILALLRALEAQS